MSFIGFGCQSNAFEEKHVAKRSIENLGCDICGVTVNSPAMLEAHFKGQRHIKKTRSLKNNESALTKINSQKNNTNLLKFLQEYVNANNLKLDYEMKGEYDAMKKLMFKVSLKINGYTFIASAPVLEHAKDAAAKSALKHLHKRGIIQKVPVVNLSLTKPLTKPVYNGFPLTVDKSLSPAGSESNLQQFLKKVIAEISLSDTEKRTANNMLLTIMTAFQNVADELTRHFEEQKTDVNPPLPISVTGKKSNVDAEKNDPLDKYRVLKAIIPTGNVFKRIMLKDNKDITLVALCANKPTVSLMNEVYSRLKPRLQSQNFSLEMVCTKGKIFIRSNQQSLEFSINVIFTSLVLRESNFIDYSEADKAKLLRSNPNPIDMLPIDACLNALTEIRHAKWFHLNISKYQSAVDVVKLLHYICLKSNADSPWNYLSKWSYELLVDYCISIPNPPLDWLFRKVIETLASGIFLPGGKGIFDPCEVEPTDVASHLSLESRDRLTINAFECLRLLAFDRFHEIFNFSQLNLH